MARAAISLLCLLAHPSIAADLNGRVLEDGKDVWIPGALVHLSASSAPDNIRSTLSDSVGGFSFVRLAPGEWQLTVEMLGYRPLQRTVLLAPRGAILELRLESKPLQMEPMVVWGQRDGERRHTPAYVETVPVEILQAPGADLAQTLDTATNVNVRRYGGLGSFSTLSIRGSTTEQVQVYLDGVLLNQALGGGVNIGNISLAGVESMQIYRGATPARFGGNSLGGIVHIRTRSLSQTERSYIHASAGSFGTHQLSACTSGPWRQWQYLALTEFRTSQNNFRFWDDNGTPYNPNDDVWSRRVNSDFHSFRGIVKAGRPLGSGRMQIHNTLDLSHSGISGTGIYQAKRTRLDSWRNLSEANIYGHLANGFAGYSLKAHLSLTTGEYKDLYGEVGFGTQHDRNTTISTGLHGEINTINPRRGVATLFAAGKYEDFEPENLLDKDRDQVHSRRFRSILGGEVESFPLFDRVTLTAGSQVEHLHDRLLTQEDIVGSNFEPRRKSTKAIWGFRLGAGIALTKQVLLKTHRGRYQRPPSFFELFGDRGSVLGNPDLASEEGDKWDLGIDFRDLAGGVLPRGELVYYENAVNNLIRFMQSTQQVSQPHNLDRTLLRGIETRINLRLGPKLGLDGNYVYQQSQNRSLLTYEKGNDLPNAPHHRYGLVLRAAKAKISARYSFNRESRSFLDRANLNPIPARSVHTVAIDFRVVAEVVLSVEVRNLGNNQITDVWGYPLPGRSYFVSARFEPTDFVR